MNRSSVKKWVVRGIVVLVPITYVATCSFKSYIGETALNEIRNGDSEEKVIAYFGAPTTREKQGAGYPRYANDKCVDPCVERLWFENRMAIVDEAWLVALDKNRRVIEAAHVISP